MSTINAVCTLNFISCNLINLSFMENEDGYQIYYLHKNKKDIIYTSLSKWEQKLNCALQKNKLFYITFVGVSLYSNNIPDYYYITLYGNQIKYKMNCDKIELSLSIPDNLEKTLYSIFKENIGIFIQIYL